MKHEQPRVEYNAAVRANSEPEDSIHLFGLALNR